MSSMSLCFVNKYWFSCFRQVGTGTTKAWDCCGRFKNTWLELPTLKKLKCVTSKDKRQRWADVHPFVKHCRGKYSKVSEQHFAPELCWICYQPNNFKDQIFRECGGISACKGQGWKPTFILVTSEPQAVLQ